MSLAFREKGISYKQELTTRQKKVDRAKKLAEKKQNKIREKRIRLGLKKKV